MTVSEPLGICSLAAVLRKSQLGDVTIYDPCIDGDIIDVAVSKCLSIEHDILGISVLEADCSNVHKFIKQYRLYNPSSIIVIGGHGPSLSPEKFINDDVCGVFIGEGEISWPRFISVINENDSLHTVPGFAFKNTDGELVITDPPRKVENLDSLPFIARDTLPLLIEKYGKNVAAQLMSSRSCYMDCSYCSIKAFSRLQEGEVYRERSVSSIVSEIQYLYDNFGVRSFRFADDNFMPPNPKKAKEKIKSFCDEILKSNMNDLKFQIQCRPDNVQPQLISKLMKIGLKSMLIGIESINSEDLDLYCRKGDPLYTYKIMKELQKIGFSCDVNAKYRLKVGYITFNPYSNRKTLQESIKFLREFNITPKKILNYLRPYKKTKVYDKLLTDNLLTEDDMIVFKDQDTSEIFYAIQEIMEYISSFREIVRFPVKLNKKLQIGHFNKKLDDTRILIDNLCFDAIEELLKSNISQINDIKSKYISLFDTIKSDSEVLEELNRFKELPDFDSNCVNSIRNIS